MFSSHIDRMILTIYKDKRTVFRLPEVSLLTGETDFQSLNKKLNYYVHTGKLNNPRKGIYTKPEYDKQELACKIYTPSYISLEYVLQRSGVIFQYDSTITSISYLRRTVEIDNQIFSFRKIKDEILINSLGIERMENGVNIATPERAFLDILYYNKNFYIDNPNPLDKKMVEKILSVYSSKILCRTVNKLLQNA